MKYSDKLPAPGFFPAITSGKQQSLFSPTVIEEGRYYRESRLKILFILKEEQTPGGPFNLGAYLKDGAQQKKSKWDNVARWIYGIKHTGLSTGWKELSDPYRAMHLRTRLLPEVAVINKKSRHAGISPIDDNDTAFLNRQLTLFVKDPATCPDLIIAAGRGKCWSGTDGLIRGSGLRHPEWKRTSNGVFYLEFRPGKFLVRYYQPDAPFSDEVLYSGITEAWKEIRKRDQA